MIETSLQASRHKLNKHNRKYCFEIFGYDFMVDAALKPWLIEINTNPCLEESSKLLKQLIPRMINDAFKLTLDSLFPPLPEFAEAMPESCDKFSVDNYADSVNMWGERLLKLN